MPQPKPGPSRKPRSKVKRKPGLHSHKTAQQLEKRNLVALERSANEFVPPDDLQAFEDLPISSSTKRGLKKAFFVNMTDIQAKSLPVSLKGKDVLGAARTGSGKTLSFLIAILEMLYRKKWGPQDGLGALIISPTRELAIQIFEVLRSIGGYHSFSAGLVIGGKNLKDEKDRLSRMNILVATPGRLLQHMDQTVGFECDNLQMLVLDEADRILDMGFARTLSALLSHLPKSRQTLLFSATQTDSVNDLARLSLKDPVYVAVKEKGYEGSTPKSLEQHYVLCDLDKKLDILWSFIKTHLQSKVLVFMSSGKQVRFAFETFRKLQPGVPLLHLHGKQKQTTRLTTFKHFTTTSHAVLFATDIAARGLDFPAVDWVLQLDAPEDAETYIHRVGRTARYESAGKGLLFLVPSEKDGMLAALKRKNIDVANIKIKSSKTQSIANQLQSLCFKDPEIKYLGQRAFISYMQSIHLQKDKTTFKLSELPVEAFAASLGLPGVPKIRFLTKEMAKKKNASREAAKAAKAAMLVSDREGSGDDEEDGGEASPYEDGSSASDEEDDREEKAPEAIKAEKNNGVRTKYDRMFERKNQNILSEHYAKIVDHEADDDDADDFITLKRADHVLESDGEGGNGLSEISKRKDKIGRSKRGMLKYKGQGHKLVFDEEGKPHELYEMDDADEVLKGLDIREEGRKFAEGERARMGEVDVLDKEQAKERKREKKRKRKERDRGGDLVDGDEDGDGGEYDGPMLETVDYDDGYVSPEFDLSSESEEEAPPTKRGKKGGQEPANAKQGRTLEEEEELALRMLNRR